MTLQAGLLLGVAAVLAVTVIAACAAGARRRDVLDRSAARAHQTETPFSAVHRSREGDPPS